jgi:serine/threonine-protein phosphatase PP1 catalytic subunit
LLWNTFDRCTVEWKPQDEAGEFEVVSRFLQKHDMEFIVRGHDIVDAGYEFSARRHVLTLCSAADVVAEDGSKPANTGAIVRVDESLRCHFEVR